VTNINSKQPKRWVIKFGSAILTNNGAGLDRRAIDGWVKQIAELMDQGIEVVLVSSGAIAEGISRLGWNNRPDAIHELQAAAAVGQMGLIQAYEASFLKFKRHTAQILLDHDDVSNRQRYLNARGALKRLIDLGVVPIVNENDTVATDEIRFGDNDRLAALVANLIDADLLVILTDKDGLYDADPDLSSSAKLVSLASAEDKNLELLASNNKSGVGSGGMATKIKAARIASSSGCDTLIGSGRAQNILLDIKKGNVHGTVLTASQKPIAAKKQWLMGQLKAKGQLVVDSGAEIVIMKQGRSLLPVGIIEVVGKFDRGDLVTCVNPMGQELARGLVNYSAYEVNKIKGQNTNEVLKILGYRQNSEVVHRDNMVVLG
jgi:glutamate 5-kinase